MIFDTQTLAQLAGLALLAGIGHVASLLIGTIDHTGRRDRAFGVMVLFILLCSPVFFDNRPHNLAMMLASFSLYLVAVAWLEMRVATVPFIKNFMTAGLIGTIALAVAALVYFAMNVPVVPNPATYAETLLARNVVLFLILTRGAYFAWRQQNLRPFVALYALMLVISPFLLDFALAICGPLLAIGCWALGKDLRRLCQRMTS